MNYNQFDEIPITVRDFICSPSHMDFPTISERQLRFLEYMLGKDITKVFDNNRYMAVMCWGKGSGKDQCSIFLFCYLVYYLLCLKNPQEFLRLPSIIEPIDMLNMAPTRELANQVFFEKLRNQVKNWRWLKNKYKIVSSGDMNDEEKVVIQKTLIQFPKHITLYSGNCVHGDTRVPTITGLRPIRELQVGDKILTWDDKYLPITEKIETKTDLYEVRLTNGLSVKCSSNHKFFLLKDGSWVKKPLHDLQVGDYLWCKTGIPTVSRPPYIKLKRGSGVKNFFYRKVLPDVVEVTDELAWLVGLFLTDGHLNFQRNGLVISQSAGPVFDKIKRVSSALFGSRAKVRSYKNKGNLSGKCISEKTSYIIQLLSIDIYSLFESIGAITDGKKTFPWGLLSYSDSISANLLAGLVDGDGWVGPTKIGFMQSDKYCDIFDGAAYLFNKFDIMCNMEISDQTNPEGLVHTTRPRKYLKVCSSYFTDFLEKIPTVKRADPLIRKEKHFKMYPGIGSLLQSGSTAEERSENLSRSVREDRVSEGYFIEHSHHMKNTKLQKIILHGMYAIKIKSITKLSDCETTYDYVVEDKSLIANGIFTYDSEAGSFEGKSLVAFVIDEASGLATQRTDKADEIYRMLRTSAVSRFGRRYKGVIISYPRRKDDFTIKMFMENLDNLNVYTDKGPTWEVLPPSKYSGKFFRFKDYLIPIEFKEDFDKDPFGSMSSYLCIPTEVEMPFIEMPERVDRVNTYLPIALFETYAEGNYIKKRLLEWRSSCDKTHVVGIDLGQKHDSAALTVAHMEKTETSFVYVQDLLLTWTPEVQNERIVSFTNVGEIITELAKKIKISSVVFDQWNSAQLIEELNSKGISSYDITLNKADYYFLKELIYSEKIKLVCDAALSNELKKLVDAGGKIDHLPQFSKDRVDSLTSAVKMLRSSIRPDTGWGSLDDAFTDISKGGFTRIAPGSRF